MDLKKPLRKLIGLGPVATPLDKRPPYKSYTTEFDRTVDSRGLDEVIGKPDEGTRRDIDLIWKRCVSIASGWEREILDVSARFADRLRSEPTAITFLIDLSGSMRDAKIESTIAAMSSVYAPLRHAGCVIEILGFTTIGWHGGRSRLKWRKRGGPASPGRLCDLLHVVFCPADEDLTDAHLRPMARPDLLRENVDGEALLWAASRLRARRQPRKLLLVLSDGAPVDDATLFHNHLEILEDHLLSVIRELGSDRQIHLAALRVGFEAGWEIGAYYPRSATSRDVSRLGPDLMDLIGGVLV